MLFRSVLFCQRRGEPPTSTSLSPSPAHTNEKTESGTTGDKSCNDPPGSPETRASKSTFQISRKNRLRNPYKKEKAKVCHTGDIPTTRLRKKKQPINEYKERQGEQGKGYLAQKKKRKKTLIKKIIGKLKLSRRRTSTRSVRSSKRKINEADAR